MTVAVAERPALLGCQVPRVEVIPDGDEHPKWPEVLETLDRVGIVLDPWQLRVLWASLLRDGEQWAAFAVAVCCPRQNGKNAILEARELVGALVLGEKLIIHTAHLADTSKEAFKRLDDLIDSNDWLRGQVAHVWRTNGHESIEFTNGSRIRFRTRTRGGGRGFSGSPVIFDEPMFLNEVSMGSILPVMSAQPDPQAWYTGSAVDQTIHEDGVVFARVRDRALNGTDSRLAYFEWSLDFEAPDEVPEGLLQDPAAAAVTNPAYGIRIRPEYVEAELNELDARTAAVERFGVGDWPPVDGTANQVIPIATWDALADDPASASAKIGEPFVLAFDVTPSRSKSAVAIAGLRPDGDVQVEITDHQPGTAWVAARVAQLVERHAPDAVLCTGKAAEALLPQLVEAGVTVEHLESGVLALACGVLFDMVDEERLRHLGAAELRTALKGATKRELEDGWAWSRKNSAVDISPLVAATVAVWKADQLSVSEGVGIF